jgi:hypothetical protein
MTIDQAYGKALKYLEAANVIWEAQDKERYCIAENYHNEGIKIMNQYFSETKVLTQIQDVDSMLP